MDDVYFLEKGRTVGKGSRVVLAAFQEPGRVQTSHEVVTAVGSGKFCIFAVVAKKKLAGGRLPTGT
jgi:hypothetical protein